MSAFTYEECVELVRKKIPGKFVTFSSMLQNGKYEFTYIDKAIPSEGFSDKMPCCPDSILIDPRTGMTEKFNFMKLANRAERKRGTPEGDELRKKYLEHLPLEETEKKIFAYF